MKSHEFTIIASGLDPEAEDFADRFFEAGCDDATLSFQKGVIILEFAREAVSFSKAVASAYADVRHAGASVDRIEPDYLVSLSEIPSARASRARRSRSTPTASVARAFPRRSRASCRSTRSMIGKRSPDGWSSAMRCRRKSWSARGS